MPDLLALLLALPVAVAWWALHRKHAAAWLPAATAHGLRQWMIRRPVPTHVLFCFVDHFEPSRGQASDEVAAARLQRWLDGFPAIASQHRDDQGRPAQHTWFYPWDEWRDGEVQALSGLCYDGLGEIELHLHHDHDTSDQLRQRLAAALQAFAGAGALLSAGPAPEPRFGFIHGNWCLDNSRPDGGWCGVNDELRVLAEAGCYADFTLPTPDPTQPRVVNTIYRATDDPARPKSHDRGRPLTVGRVAPGDLLLIPGPLGINWRDWHHRYYPAIERSEIAASSPVTATRVDFWLRCGVGVRGRPDWVFVKVHAHGCVERDQDAVLGELRGRLHRLLADRCGDGRHALWYCTARELANLALAAEAGASGEPGPWLDHRHPPPANCWFHSDQPADILAVSEATGEVRSRVVGRPVRWRFAVGPLAEVTGPATAVRWQGDEVTVSGGEGLTVRRR